MGTQLPSSKRATAATNFQPMYCGQTAGWIKIPLATEVGLGPGDIALDGYPAPHPKGCTTLNFRPCLLWSNGWMDQDGTWYGGQPRPRPHCARWRLSSPCPEKGPQPPPSNFQPMSVVAKRLDRLRYHLIRRQASAQATLCNMGIQLPQKGTALPEFRPVSTVAKRSPISATAEHLYITTSCPENSCYYIFMAALRSRCGHYIFVLWFLLSSSFPLFYSASQCSHCKRCTSCGNSVHLSVRSVRLSVCLSHAGIVSKRLQVARCSLHCQIAKCV